MRCILQGALGAARVVGAGQGHSLVHIGIRPQVLEHFLPLLLVKHQIDALAAVTPLDAALGPHEEWLVFLPISPATPLAGLQQGFLAVGPEPLQQLIVKGQKELATSRIALPAGTAGKTGSGHCWRITGMLVGTVTTQSL